ncbi:hypothetical protein [Paenibacillus sp. Soil750]|uniref:hypothetical protein n=1 Tax=Paenibacillus sp. Soil750 TaxID=1736398 RepID=UPI0006FD5587|nr:hypothetical protein [Paenibacillus sp. Soil750]KRE59426.1 hypothetical protein ASL11_24580 [Paenibacillus sp. Soil750]
MRSQATFQDLLRHILEDGQACGPEEDRHLSEKRTMDYLEQFSHLQMTIEELAEMAGMSRNYYMRSSINEIFTGDPVSIDKQLDIQTKLLLTLDSK